MSYIPYFVFENFAFESGVTTTPSTEASGYDADNLEIPHPTVRWKTTSSTGNTIKMVFSSERYYDTLALIQTDFVRHGNLLSETQSLDTSSNWTEPSGCTIDELTGLDYTLHANLIDEIGPTKLFAFERTTDGLCYTELAKNMGSTGGLGVCISAWVARDYAGPSSNFRLSSDDGGSQNAYANFNLANGTMNSHTESGVNYIYQGGGVSDTVVCGNYIWHRCYYKLQKTPDNTSLNWTFQVLSSAYNTTVTADASDYELFITGLMIEPFNIDGDLPSAYPISDETGTMLNPHPSGSPQRTNWISPFRGDGFMDSPNGLSNAVMRMGSDTAHTYFPKNDTDADINIIFPAPYPYIQAGAMVVGKSWTPSGAFKQFQITLVNVTSSQSGTSRGHLYRGSRTPYRKVKMTFDYNSHDDAMEFVRQSRCRGDNTPILFFMEDENGAILKDEWIIYGYLDYTPVVSQIIDKWRVTVQMSEVLG